MAKRKVRKSIIPRFLVGTKNPNVGEKITLGNGLRHWHSINDGRLLKWSEDLVKKAIVWELANNCRPDIIHRLYGRFARLRKQREMKELMGSES
jgi:hypothetical protein